MGSEMCIRDRRDDDGVGFLNQEAREFVQPDFLTGVGGWSRELSGDGGGDGRDGVGVGWVGVEVVQGFEVFGKLEG